MPIFITILATAFWVIYIAKLLLFWLYLWQTKEYRRDRMRAHFELPSSKKLLFNYRVLLAAAILGATFMPLAQTPALWAAVLFFAFLGTRAANQWFGKLWKVPRLTKKMLLLASICVAFYGAAIYLAYSWGVVWTFRSLVLLDIASPLIVSFAVAVIAPASRVMKLRVLKRAQNKRKAMPDLLVIGITGSYGKTSTKEYLAHILGKKFRVLKTEANHNTEIGVAQEILGRLTKEHEVFVAEMGAYRRGEIATISRMAKPQIGILTGINSQHASLFGGLENTKKAKYELIESLPPRGLAVFNGDDENALAYFEAREQPKRVYSAKPLNIISPPHQRAVVRKVRETKTGSELEIALGDEAGTLKVPLVGAAALNNVMGAITVADSLGMTFKEIQERALSFQTPPHTMQLKRGIKGSTVIDDTYSGNPDGALEALAVLKRIEGRKKICVLQPLIELGDSAEIVHRKLGAKIGESCDFCIITSSDYFSDMKREAVDAGIEPEAMMSIPSAFDAMRKAQEITNEEDVVLLENRISPLIINGLTLEE